MARHPGFPRAVRREFWRLIGVGLPVQAAAVGCGVSHRTGKYWFHDSGGVPPVDLSAPSGRYLSLSEREDIAMLVAAGATGRAIARSIGRAPSTVCRELRRNRAASPGGRPPYRASLAHDKAEQRARRPKTSKLAADPRLRHQVQVMLEQRMSPEQIAGRLPAEFPDDASMRVSHEAIYQALYVFGRGALRRELTRYLRTGRTLRKPRRRVDARTTRPRIPGMVMIADRPAEVEDRVVPGDWEGDLITGAENRSAIGTLVERTTRYTMLLHLPHGHGADQLHTAITAAMLQLPTDLRRSLTWDQGIEMAQHARTTIATNLAIYFCDPHSPWQRGTNENTNGLLRQYFPKGTDLGVHSAAHLAEVEAELNARPRKVHGFRTPAEVMAPLLQTGTVATTT
jgi:IS30 family transposase